jgi:malonate-semialdehyde dehydrogenase (acetylating)/methylmalonate-semialdehyde dehydrogenase
MSSSITLSTPPPHSLQALNVVAGQMVPGSGPTHPVLSPYTGAAIGSVTHSTAADLPALIAPAQRAQALWAETPLKERCRILFQVRNRLLDNQDSIAQLKAWESGKTYAEALAGLLKGIEVLEFALSLQNTDLGGKLEVSRGVSCEFRRMPLGIVACVTPFNFPAMVPLWTIPISLALGNACIWKPSEKVPLTSMKLVKAFQEGGLPAGLLSIFQGDATAVQALIAHPEVQAVSFVGSTPVARAVYQQATAQGKRALALGGAKNHILLLPDAPAELAGPAISDSFTGCSGQRCMAASVVLAVGNIDRHLEKIRARAQSLVLGRDQGALISAAQKTFLEKAIAEAERQGAQILLDGRQAPAPAGFEGGYWLGATILDQVQPGTLAATQELFGPILSIIRCPDIQTALQIQKSSPYGNSCSVFTSSGALAERVIRSVPTGMVGVNVGVPVPREPFSFGGTRDSKFGHGEITGPGSLDFWSNWKKITVKWEPQTDNNWMS